MSCLIRPPHKVSSVRLTAALQHLFAAPACSSTASFQLPSPSSASGVCQRCGGVLAVILWLGKQPPTSQLGVSTREAEPLPGRCHHSDVYTEGCPPPQETPTKLRPLPGCVACEGKVTHPRASSECFVFWFNLSTHTHTPTLQVQSVGEQQSQQALR